MTNLKLDPWESVTAYVFQDDLHNRLTPRIVDVAYTAFCLAKSPNKEDEGSSDWFTDTKPTIERMIDTIYKEVKKELEAQ